MLTCTRSFVLHSAPNTASASLPGESIAALIEAGLLERQDSSPGTAAQLSVTARGKALLQRAYPHVQRINDEGFAALTGPERRTLRTLMRKLLRSGGSGGQR